MVIFWLCQTYWFFVMFTFLGYCCIIYMQCSTSAFRIHTSTQAAYTKSQIGSNCSEDYIGIEGMQNIFLIFHSQYLYPLWATIFLFTSKGSSQSGLGNSNSVYCGGFLNDFPAATTDAKIRGNF